jgi:hypothetical protein
LGKPFVLLQARIDPELKKFFDSYCAATERSQAFVLDRLVRNLMDRWRERLPADDFARLMDNKIDRKQLQAIYRRATGSRPELVVLDSSGGNAA